MPNLRDPGGYKTSAGKTVAYGLVYRSKQLSGISPNNMKELELKYAHHPRTEAERNKRRRSYRQDTTV